MKLLLEKDADPSRCLDFNNTSPLHVAVGNGHNGIVERLIQAIPYLMTKVETFLAPTQSPPLFTAALKGQDLCFQTNFQRH